MNLNRNKLGGYQTYSLEKIGYFFLSLYNLKNLSLNLSSNNFEYYPENIWEILKSLYKLYRLEKLKLKLHSNNFGKYI